MIRHFNRTVAKTSALLSPTHSQFCTRFNPLPKNNSLYNVSEIKNVFNFCFHSNNQIRNYFISPSDLQKGMIIRNAKRLLEIKDLTHSKKARSNAIITASTEELVTRKRVELKFRISESVDAIAHETVSATLKVYNDQNQEEDRENLNQYDDRDDESNEEESDEEGEDDEEIDDDHFIFEGAGRNFVVSHDFISKLGVDPRWITEELGEVSITIDSENDDEQNDVINMRFPLTAVGTVAAIRMDGRVQLTNGVIATKVPGHVKVGEKITVGIKDLEYKGKII